MWIERVRSLQPEWRSDVGALASKATPSNRWVFDTGAISHMTNNLDFEHELDLAAEMELRTRVFHSSLLELARQDPPLGEPRRPHRPSSSVTTRSGLSKRPWIPVGSGSVGWDITRGLGITSATTSTYQAAILATPTSLGLCLRMPDRRPASTWVLWASRCLAGAWRLEEGTLPR